MVHGPTSPAVHPQSAHWRRPRHSQSSILISRPGPPRRPAGLKLSFPPAPAQILAPACQAGPQPGGRPQARRQCPVLAAAESPPLAARARCVAQHHLPQRQTVRLEPWHLSPGSASRAITNVPPARCARCPAGAGRRPEHPPVCLMRMCPVLIPRPELPRPGPVRHQATVRQACEGVHASLSLSSLSRPDRGLSLSGTVLVRQPLTVPRVRWVSPPSRPPDPPADGSTGIHQEAETHLPPRNLLVASCRPARRATAADCTVLQLRCRRPLDGHLVPEPAVEAEVVAVGLAGCAVAGGGVEGMPAVCRPQRPVEALDGARLATSPGAAGAQAMTIGRAGAAGRGGDLPVRRCRAVRRSQ